MCDDSVFFIVSKFCFRVVGSIFRRLRYFLNVDIKELVLGDYVLM